jgi:hypothetical protein
VVPPETGKCKDRLKALKYKKDSELCIWENLFECDMCSLDYTAGMALTCPNWTTNSAVKVLRHNTYSWKKISNQFDNFFTCYLLL